MSKQRIINKKNNGLVNSSREKRIVEIVLNGFQNRNEYFKNTDIPKYERRVTRIDYGECFMGIYEYPEHSDVGKKDKLLYSRFIPIDIDSDYLVKALDDTRKIITHLEDEYGIDKNNIRVSFSGHKGFHIEIPSVLFGVKPSKDLPIIHKKIIEKIVPKDIKIDTKIYQPRGLLRMPNTINKQDNLYKIPLHLRELFNLSIDEIKEQAKKPRGFILNKSKPKKSDVLFEIYQDSKREVQKSKSKTTTEKRKTIKKLHEKFLVEKIMESERNSTLTSLAGKLYSHGIESELVDKLVESMNETRCEPPLKEKEVDTILKSVSNYQDITTNSLAVVKLSDIQEAKPREWLLKGAIPINYPTIIYGEGGSGKSYTSLFIAIQSARGGQTVCGHKFSKRPLNVLYLDFELDSSEFQRRTRKICNGLGLYKLPDNIFYSQAKKPLRDLLPDLENFIRENGIDFIVIDSFTVSGVDAMKENEVIRVLNNLISMNVTILIIDHQSKNSFGANSPYGSVFKSNLVRSQFQITSKLKDTKTTTITLKHNKSNFGAKLDSISFDLVFENDKITFHEVKTLEKRISKQNLEKKQVDVIINAIVEVQKNKKDVLQKDILEHLKGKISKNKALELLKQGKGQYWKVRTGEKNKKIYSLNPKSTK